MSFPVKHCIVPACFVLFFQPGRMYCTAWESSWDAIRVLDSRRNIRGTIHLFGRETFTSLSIEMLFYAFIPSSCIQKAKWRWNPLCVINNCLGRYLSACLVHVATLTFQNSSCISHSLTAKITLPLDSSFGTRAHAKVVAQRIFCMEDAQMHKHFQRHNSSVGRWKL